MHISLKKTSLLLAVCWSAAAGAVSLDYKFFPEVPRKIVIGKTPKTTLMENGKVQFEIVVPKNASPSAKYAAKEAAELLSKATGSKIKPKAMVSGKVPAIIIGDADLAQKAGIDLKKLDRDGFVIKTIGKDVLIIGRDHPTATPNKMKPYGDGGERATIFGVYDFLERFAGIRFYFPGELGTIIPKRKEWKLPEIDLYDRPDKMQRSYYASWPKLKNSLPPELGKNPDDWRHHMHLRFHSWTWPCCHGLVKQGYRTRFNEKTHPEFYARNEAGKSVLEIKSRQEEHYCFNSPIREEIYKDAIAFLSGRPASERDIRPYTKNRNIVGWHSQLDPKVPVFDITPNDGYYPCQCEKCRKLYTAKFGRNRELSNFMWRYYAEGAERVKGLGYIAAWIYWPTLVEPDFKLPDNILFVMCPRGPWNCGDEKLFKAEIDRIKSWGKVSGNRMRLWNYMIKYPRGIYPGIPTFAPHAVAQYYKAAAPYICGAFSEVGVERFMFQYLNLYVYLKVLWDNQLDVDSLLKEHYALMFGEAAVPMSRFYETLEKLWMSVIGGAVDTPTGPQSVILPDLELWQNRYSESQMKELEGLLKTAEAAVPANSEEAKRIRLIKREVWQVLADTRAQFKNSQELKKYWKFYATEAADPVVIDGKLDDAAWKKAKPYYLTRAKNSVEVRTLVRMLYDKQNLYFSFECEEPDTANMLKEPFADDVIDRWANSTVEILLNPDGSRKNYYQLMIDSAGKLTDLYNNHGATDLSWNSGAEIKTTVIPGKKWIAEVRLPRASLNQVKSVFPVNFMRHRARLKQPSESYVWNPFMKSHLLVDKWGTATLGPDPNPSVIQFGDFDAPVRNNQWLGPWHGSALLKVDNKIYLTGGASAVLDAENNQRTVAQCFKLKPETTYEISFFAKLDKVKGKANSGVYARFDECGGKSYNIPKVPLSGTMPWTRVSKTIKTDKKCGTRRKGFYTEYIRFTMPRDCSGKAWIDHVEIREVKDAK